MSNRETSLALRWLNETVANHGKGSELDWSEASAIREYVYSKFNAEEMAILHAFTGIESEFTRGHRCGVCGRTEKQNTALGYDCINEC